MKKLFIGVLLLTAVYFPLTTVKGNEIDDLKSRVEKLEKEVAELKKALKSSIAQNKLKQIVAAQCAKARARMRKDSGTFNREQLIEIERLYQVANRKFGTEEAKKSLEKLIKKYNNANRTGCAVLYLGQMNKGEKAKKYLELAIKDYSDCFYGDGVQVGAYARLNLAYYYKRKGDNDKANELFAEIKKLYPNAISHRGNLLFP